MNLLRQVYSFSRNSNNSISFKTMNSALLALVAAVALTASPAQAANLLVDSGFDQDIFRRFVPNGWTRFAPPTAKVPPDLWIVGNEAPPHSSPLCFKEWGASYNGTNNAAGIYQDFSAAPGSTFQASGWFYTRGSDVLGADCYLWLEVSFLDSSGNLLALYKSDNFTASVGTDNWFQYQVNHSCNISSPVSIGDPFFNTYPISGNVTQLVAPVGTTTVLYRFVYVQVAS